MGLLSLFSGALDFCQGIAMHICRFHSCLLTYYSLLSASMGFSLAALLAGI